MHRKRARRLALLAVVVMSLAGPALSAQALAPGIDAFGRYWAREDLPIAEGVVQNRGWMWGPEAFTAVMEEPYDGGTRLVQYFDKSRMERTYPDAAPNDPWYVTNGRLSAELVTGLIQVGEGFGDERDFLQVEPAQVNVAGDPFVGNGPTYATFESFINEPAAANGATLTTRIDANGNTWDDPSLAGYGVTAAYLLDQNGLRHQVASPFWQFMNATGIIYENGAYVEGNLMPVNAFYATGFPMTEAYWADVTVGGQTKPVLIQVFERRVLTYTPSNDPEWRVEMGNVGQHYYRWRYNTDIPSEPAPVSLGEYDNAGPASLGEWPAQALNGQGEVLIANQSPYDMTIFLDGPVAETMSIPACVDCVVYDSPAQFEGCRNDTPVDTVTLPPGNYRVEITWAGEALPAAGHWTIVPDAFYGSCWYVTSSE